MGLAAGTGCVLQDPSSIALWETEAADTDQHTQREMRNTMKTQADKTVQEELAELKNNLSKQSNWAEPGLPS